MTADLYLLNTRINKVVPAAYREDHDYFPQRSMAERIRQLKIDMENMQQEIHRICNRQQEILDWASEKKKEMDALDSRKNATKATLWMATQALHDLNNTTEASA